MDYGSSYVWMYDDSDEEVVSDTELQEGMWLSEEEPEAFDPQPVPSKQGSQAQDQEAQLLSSTTKFQHFHPPEPSPPPVPTSSEPPLPPTVPPPPPPPPPHAPTLAVAGAEGSDKLNYVEVQHVVVGAAGGKPPPPPPPPYSSAAAVRELEDRVKYVELNPKQPGPTPQAKSYSAPVPAAPLRPRQPRGIIKNRLGSGLKKQKRNRVQWQEKSNEDHSQDHRHRYRRADTNVLCVKFNKLIESSHVHTGDAVVCGNPECTAILSHLSKVEKTSDDHQTWTCEYCGTENEIDPLDPEEVPKESDTTFMISPAPVGVAGASGGAEAPRESIVIFCIDVSGSMCVTTEVPGKFKLKGFERVKSLSSYNTHGEDQYLPRQRRDVTYVSRLQSVQAAVDHQLQELSRNQPSQCVGLITFSDEVTVIGDGCSEVVTVAGDRLWDADALDKVGTDVTLPGAIKNSCKSLSKKVFSLEEGGQTALGPSILLCISLASRVPGSSVVVCTDGLANRGVGNLDGVQDHEEFAAAEAFYEDLGTLAVDKGVTVSLITIKGTDCRTAELGKVADRTGGKCIIVDPMTITKEFGSILANPVIATDMMTKIILHHQLYFRTEESQESVLTIPVGNVTAETELSYDYGVRSKRKKTRIRHRGAADSDGGAGGKEEPKVPGLVLLEGRPHLPFQLQFRYSSRDGSKLMRVITDAKPVTKDRNLAEKDIKMAVLGSHAAHKTAALAMDGEYTSARANAIGMQRLLQRNSHASVGRRALYCEAMSDLIPLENRLKERQMREHSTRGLQYSDDEEEEGNFHVTPSVLAGSKMGSKKKNLLAVPRKRKAMSRMKEMEDDLATYCYQMKTTSSTMYSKSAVESDSDSDSDSDD